MSLHEIQVGIDAISFSVPSGYIELSELALARGIPKEKYLSGLFVKQMAVAQMHEDPVTLATLAARRLFQTSRQSVKEVGLCIVGTETGVDHAKPISSFLHSLLGLEPSCRVFDTKHACFGGTAGLLYALDWISSGSNRGKSALVVCSDIARYPLLTAGEPTQGAGAVALLIKENPRLITLTPGASGCYSQDVYDFWRPLGKKDALTDGHFSVACYLEALTGAYQDFKKNAQKEDPLYRSCYHVPYGKMAQKAHRHRKMLDGFSEEEAQDSFTVEVASSLDFPSRVGNIYTGSLYLALASLLHHEATTLVSKTVGFFSYGSGCTAEFFAGKVCDTAPALVKELKLEEPLLHRTSLSISTYEDIRRADETSDTRSAPISEAPFSSKNSERTSLEDDVVFLGIDAAQRRVYKNLPSPKMKAPIKIL